MSMKISSKLLQFLSTTDLFIVFIKKHSFTIVIIKFLILPPKSLFPLKIVPRKIRQAGDLEYAVCNDSFTGNSKYSKGANLSRILIDSSLIPNPEPTAWMNIYMTAPMFHKINHPSQSAFRFSCLTPPFLLCAVSYVPPYALGKENIRKLSSVSDLLSSLFGWRGKKDRKMEREWELSEMWSEMSPLFRCGGKHADAEICKDRRKGAFVGRLIEGWRCRMDKRRSTRLYLVALGAGGWGLWALERAGPHRVAVTHFVNIEGRDEHKLVQEEESEIWASRMMERRRQRAQMRWAHHNNYPSCLWWPTKPIKSLEKSWFTIMTLSQGKGTKDDTLSWSTDEGRSWWHLGQQRQSVVP